MIIVILASIIALILTYIESLGQFNDGMKKGFFLLTFLAMIHYDYGNDYEAYYRLYKDIASSNFTWSTLYDVDFYHDPGWIVINFLCKYIGGFFTLVALISLFQGYVYYHIIKRYVQKKWWVFAVFIYVINTSTYIINFSMLRQGLVATVFLACWPLIEKKKWLLVTLLLLLMSTIHGSAKLLIPFAFWGYLPMKKAKYWAVGYGVFLASLYTFGDLANDILQQFMKYEDVQKYADKYKGSDKVSVGGIGFFIYLTPVIASIYYLYNNTDKTSKNNHLVSLSTIGSLILPFGLVLSAIGRLGNYFAPYAVTVLPIVYSSISNKKMRTGLLGLYILITLYDYYLFWVSPIWIEKYSTFHTIFGKLLRL